MKTLSNHISESLNDTKRKQEIRIVYFEGSYQFNSEKVIVSLDEAKEIAKKKILEQVNYRATKETIWCEFYLLGSRLDEFEHRISYKNGKFE